MLNQKLIIDKPEHYGGSQDQWDKHCDNILSLPSYICLFVLPDEEWYTGYVENSFSMGFDITATRLWWSSENAIDNFFGKTYKIDGWKNARYYLDYVEREYPNVKGFIFDAYDDEALPVMLDWEKYLLDNVPGKNGWPRNKWGSRNIQFTIDTSKPFIR